MSKPIRLPIGTVVGRLVVIGYGDSIRKGKHTYSTTIVQCQCDQKTVKTIPTIYLTNSTRKTLSCGCLAHEHKKADAKHLPRIDHGYRYVYAPDSPSARKNGGHKGYVYEHRLVMERFLGRPLTKDEDVHHIDFNGLNNSLSNLIVLKKSDHYRLHRRLRAFGIRRPISKSEIMRMSYPSKNKRCMVCGKELSMSEWSCTKVDRCVECARKESRHLDWPKKEELLTFLQTSSISQTSKFFNVSWNTIKNWCLHYGIWDMRRRKIAFKQGSIKGKSHSF